MDKNDIRTMDKILDLSMSDEKINELKSTYSEWMERAVRLDKKMSKLGLMVPPAANIFIH